MAERSPKRKYKRQNEAPICPKCGVGRLWTWSSQDKAYVYCTIDRKLGCGYSKTRGREEDKDATPMRKG